MTPVPTPHYFTTYDFDGGIVNRPYSTPEELKTYGADEYRRGIDAALAVLVSRGLGNGSVHLQVAKLLEAK